MELSRARVALYGRFLARPRAQAVDAMSELGGITERDLTRRTDLLVIGLGARNLIPSGHLSRKILEAGRQGVPVMGELRLWLGLGGVFEPAPTYPISRISPQPEDWMPELLNAFDIIVSTHDHCRFGDVATLRSASELINDGHEISSVVRVLLRAKVVAPSGRHHTIAVDGQARLRWEDTDTELDGQGILPLPEHPTLDDIFEHALLAEAEGDMAAAERGYALCARMDKSDPIAPFNLGNVHMSQSRLKDAARQFGFAIHRDPEFAEAYYNRARVLEMSEDLVGAEEDLKSALQRDERYLDAIFNLSQIKLKQGDAPQAVSLLDQFLELSPENEWTVVARKTRRLALADIGQ